MTGLQEVVQLGGTVTVVLLFLYYLNKKDIEINKMIGNHLHTSNKIIEKNSKALTKVSVNLKELCITIKEGKNQVKS